MPTVMLNNNCNLKCSHCFADQKMKENRGSILGFSEYKKIAGFLASSGNKTIGLLGGEPTLNPEFLDIVDWSVSQGFQVTVYSNLIVRQKVVDGLKGYNSDQVNIMVNVYRDTPAELDRIKPHLRELSHLVKLTLAIDRPDFDGDFLIDLIEEFKLIRRLKLKLALPTLGGANKFLPLADYGEAANGIALLCEKAGNLGIQTEFGCGFIKCMFSAEQLQRLNDLGHSAAFSCRPIVDVDSKGKASHCLPLSNLPTEDLNKYDNFEELVDHYYAQTGAFRRAGVMQACYKCPYLNDGTCGGGCLGLTMASFNKSVPGLNQIRRAMNVTEFSGRQLS